MAKPIVKTKRQQNEENKKKYYADLFAQIKEIISRNEAYLTGQRKAKDLAAELGVDARLISAVVKAHTGDNYNALFNSYRIKVATTMLKNKKFERVSMENIALKSGFSSRQAFYIAFAHAKQMTPVEYRKTFGKPNDPKQDNKKAKAGNAKKGQAKKNSKPQKDKD